MFAPTTKFLVIDDFATMRKMVTNSLKKLGFENFETANDGQLAVASLKAASDSGAPFDIILSDWNMPEMSGLDLLKYVRNDEKFKDLPFIMITAESDQGQIVEAISNKVSDYIMKPFPPDALKEKLEKLYGKMEQKSA